MAVLGAGPAGLSAALTLARVGIPSDVYESSAHIGGLARSVELWGRRVELGPHVVTGGDAPAMSLWRELAGTDAVRVPLRRAILQGSRLMPYPPAPLGVVAALGPGAAPVLLGALVARARRVLSPMALDAIPDAEGWLTAMYGAAAYRELMGPYLTKLLGRSGREIDASFVRTVKGAAAEAASWTPTFAYPRGGLSAAWERAEIAMTPMGRIRRSAQIEAIVVTDRRILGVRSGGDVRWYDFVVSTIPLLRLLQLLPRTPPHVTRACSDLTTRNIVLVHLLVRGGPVIPHAWVLLQDPALHSGRLSDSRMWGTSSAGDHVLTVECWCSDTDAIWSLDATGLRRLIVGELTGAGFLDGASVLDVQVTRLRGALPVPTAGYGESVAVVHAHLSNVAGLLTIGRHSSFMIDSTLVAMSAGIDAARAAAALVAQAPGDGPHRARETAARSPS